MDLFAHAKFSTKLLSAFLLCALITLVVGSVGIKGTGRLAEMLSKTYSQNLVAVSSVGDALGGVASHNRSLYRLLNAKRANAPQADMDRSRTELDNSRNITEKALLTFHDLHQEKEQSDLGKLAALWPEYLASSRSVIVLIDAGELDQAATLLNTSNATAFRGMRDNLRVMAAVNNEDIKEGALAAHALERSVFDQLIIGIVGAFIVAVLIGLLITTMITRPLRVAVISAQRIADGDLTGVIVTNRKDEAGQLLTSLDHMQNSLKTTLTEIANAADRLTSAADELNAVTDESTQGLVRQNGEIQQAATAVNQMTTAVEEVARNAVTTSEASRQASNDAEQGRSQVDRAVTGINTLLADITESSGAVTELAQRVRNISDVLVVIQGIAQQTNLLALNAAIEAARAGEQGRGFAVVADEVRALAHRTQASTVEIESMISSVRTDAENAVSAMSKSLSVATTTQSDAHLAGSALDQIASGVFQINERNLVIASASEQQAQVAREVDRNLLNIQSLSEQTAAGANQTTASSQELSRLAAAFNSMVGKFKL